MNEPTESTVQAENQPITEDDVPAPDVDVTQTLQWLSVADPSQLDVATLVTHNNLGVLAALLQRMEKRVMDQAEQIRELEGLIRKVLEILRRNEETSRPSSIGSSRSSSVDSVDSRHSSTGQLAPAGDGAEALTEEDQSANAFDEIPENLLVLDDFFNRFILDSHHTTLVERPERIQASSAAFVEAARDQLGSYLGETEAQAIIAQPSSLDDEDTIDVYIALRYRNSPERHRGRGPPRPVRVSTPIASQLRRNSL
ncbi:Hypothetical protein NCS54_01140100 [Fusarium falciforme]|uniref:Hypothetical protein n=1 Tax=Fusarium falciforme TaxID=195108 RepID=UPI0023007E00|nr:Hypothetical protein NCS54_01140100 [Fusarium falciforme]WAO93844.1 Hypothetical protein NCS54_01140100 [Fusarium falciforme]